MRSLLLSLGLVACVGAVPFRVVEVPDQLTGRAEAERPGWGGYRQHHAFFPPADSTRRRTVDQGRDVFRGQTQNEVPTDGLHTVINSDSVVSLLQGLSRELEAHAGPWVQPVLQQDRSFVTLDGSHIPASSSSPFFQKFRPSHPLPWTPFAHHHDYDDDFTAVFAQSNPPESFFVPFQPQPVFNPSQGGPLFAIFPDILNHPQVVPAVPRVDELPPNYDNETHQVHVVNGSRVEVNTTTNKKTGQGHNHYFHHQVIHIRPDMARPEEVPVHVPEEVPVYIPEEVPVYIPEEVPVYIPEESDDKLPTAPEFTTERTELPSPETTELPALPEVDLESDTGVFVHGVPAEVVREEESSGSDDWRAPVSTSQHVKPRAVMSSLRVPSLQERERQKEEEDAEDESEESEGAAPPDLASDTRVNHVWADHAGMIVPEPEAEIFDLSKVLKESASSDVH